MYGFRDAIKIIDKMLGKLEQNKDDVKKPVGRRERPRYPLWIEPQTNSKWCPKL